MCIEEICLQRSSRLYNVHNVPQHLQCYAMLTMFPKFPLHVPKYLSYEPYNALDPMSDAHLLPLLYDKSKQ